MNLSGDHTPGDGAVGLDVGHTCHDRPVRRRVAGRGGGGHAGAPAPPPVRPPGGTYHLKSRREPASWSTPWITKAGACSYLGSRGKARLATPAEGAPRSGEGAAPRFPRVSGDGEGRGLGDVVRRRVVLVQLDDVRTRFHGRRSGRIDVAKRLGQGGGGEGNLHDL